MLMSMNVFHQTNPKLLSVSSHGRRIPPHSSSSSSHAPVSSPATAVKFKPKFLHFHGIQHSPCKPLLASPATMGFNPKSLPFLPCHGISHSPETMKLHPKFLHFLPCHGFSQSSCKPVLGSPATIFSPAPFALPRENEEEPTIQEDHTSISSDDVHKEQSKKVTGGEVKKVEFVVREATVTGESEASARLIAEELNRYHSHDCKEKNSKEEFDLILKKCTMLLFEPLMCIVAVRKEGENAQNGLLENNVIGTLHFYVKCKYHLDNFPEHVANPETSTIFIKRPWRGLLSNVAVDKSACQQGVGSSMLKFVIGYAKENDIPEIFVHVPRDNEPALALFGKMGFEIIDEATAEPLMEQHNLYLCSMNL